MECSVGTHFYEDCHKSVYGNVSEQLKLISSYSEDDQIILKSRLSDCELRSLCMYHELKYLRKYNHLFGNTCCDPLKIHKRTIKKGLREITLDMMGKQKHFSISLTPGKSLCSNCYTRIFVLRDKDVDLPEDEFVPPQETIAEVDAVCSALDMSPASKIMRLTTGKKSAALMKKTKRISDSIRRKLRNSFPENVDDEPEESTSFCSLGEEYNSLIEKLREKCTVSSKEEKVKIISLLPRSWSKEKIAKEFGVSEHLVRLTRELVKKDGILPDMGKRRGNKISDEVTQVVKDFYEQDENSRLCPGKKDYVSVRMGNVKEQKQKRMLLCNLRELYVHFTNTHPELKVGFSKFCSLRPKWCVIAGASGTHCVCVCKYHQNVKLMLEGSNMNVDYRELLSLMVCETEKYECMMGECTECPGEEALQDLLESKSEEMPEQIVFKQWLNTDRAQMLTVIQTYSEFVVSLTEKLAALRKHHFIAKEQSKFLKEKKETLDETECIVLADFAENYSFKVQDEIQSNYWNDGQATLHPFVYYYRSDGEVKCQSVCIISDHLVHNTAAVHTFQKHLVQDIKCHSPSVKKIIYFSDGAASQYKNRKNFVNICHHAEDFGLDAEWNFFASSHGKSACDGVGGTTKRIAAKASLQRVYTGQILSPKDLYEFCTQNISGISYVFVGEREVLANGDNLRERFHGTETVPQTRQRHRVVPLNCNDIRCYFTSNSTEFEDISLAAIRSFNIKMLKEKDYVACVYDGKWWLGIVQEVNEENNDVNVMFFKPPGPRTAFLLEPKDTCWVPLTRILRKISPLELTTATGRSYNISQKISDEISQILMSKKV